MLVSYWNVHSSIITCPLRNEWINIMRYFHTIEYYSFIKIEEVLIHSTMWMSLRNMMLSETCQIWKVTYSVHAQSLCRVQLFATLWTVASQAPLSMEFSRWECWSELPFPSPGDLPDPGIQLTFLALAGRFFTTKPPRKPHIQYNSIYEKFPE